jgi:hypothetical protein
MHRSKLLAAVIATVFPAILSAETTERAHDEARILIDQFASSLKAELVGAIKTGGPSSAIGVCKEKAPAIAASLSETSEWTIGRTSLKTRNPDNAADDWETRVLKQFESLKGAAGKDAPMSYAAVVDTDGHKAYRYMQAIPTQEVCLTCHGAEIDPQLAEVIDTAYPDDQARGYSAGDIRGAFTLTKPM